MRWPFHLPVRRVAAEPDSAAAQDLLPAPTGTRAWARGPRLDPVIRLRAPILGPYLTGPEVAGSKDLLWSVDRHRRIGQERPAGVVAGIAAVRSRREPTPLPSPELKLRRRWSRRRAAQPDPAVAELPQSFLEEQRIADLPPSSVEEQPTVRRRQPPVVSTPRAPRVVLTSVTPELVGPPVESDQPYRSIGQFERMLAELEDTDAVSLAMLTGFSSAAAPPPLPAAPQPAQKPAQRSPRRTLAETRKQARRPLPQHDPSTEPSTDLSTESGSEPSTEPSTEPGTEPRTEPSAGLGAEAGTELSIEPSTEPSAGPVAESAGELPAGLTAALADLRHFDPTPADSPHSDRPPANPANPADPAPPDEPPADESPSDEPRGDAPRRAEPSGGGSGTTLRTAAIAGRPLSGEFGPSRPAVAAAAYDLTLLPRVDEIPSAQGRRRPADPATPSTTPLLVRSRPRPAQVESAPSQPNAIDQPSGTVHQGSVYRGALAGTVSPVVVRVPPEVAGPVGARFGVVVDDVPVLRGPAVSARAAAMPALAFTADGMVHLPDDAGDLTEPGVQALVAHELAHVVQQQTFGSELPAADSPEGRQLEEAAVQTEQWFRSQSGAPAPLVHRRPSTTVRTGSPATEQVQRAMAGSSLAMEPDPLGGGWSWTAPNLPDFLQGSADPTADPGPVLQQGQAFQQDLAFREDFERGQDAAFRQGWQRDGDGTPQPVRTDPAILRRLDRVEGYLDEIRDDSGEGLGGLFAHLEDPRVLNRLAARLYANLRQRLRAELLIDRERRGALADLR